MCAYARNCAPKRPNCTFIGALYFLENRLPRDYPVNSVHWLGIGSRRAGQTPLNTPMSVLVIQRRIQSPAGLKPATSASARVANLRVQFWQVALRHVGR